MCGITGFIDRRAVRDFDENSRILERMTQAVAHRGPDGSGVWSDWHAGVGLGHRRLAILDLSPAAAQPMVSRNGRFVLVYNGELYNVNELRARLEREGVPFRTHSDTEVLLEAIANWGIERALIEVNGMFAFATWDRETRTLSLARDRIGIKPLYWIHTFEWTIFGSELKALRQHPGWRPALDRASLSRYLRIGYVPAPRTIYTQAQKLEPGCCAVVGPAHSVRVWRYWDFRREAAEAAKSRPSGTCSEARERLRSVLSDAVRRQMVADVPIGSLLSGGIDSSLVTALMQAHSARPVRTFSIGFDERCYDEARHARAVSRHLGTEHTELRLAPRDALSIIPRLPEWWDEPFADSSQIPTHLVCALARQQVKVALTGDGGDEMFGGYVRYRLARDVMPWLGWVPAFVRRRLAAAVQRIPSGHWEGMSRFVPSTWRPSHVALRVHKVAALLAATDAEDLYERLAGGWPDSQQLLLAGDQDDGSRQCDWDLPAIADPAERMQAIDTLTYLPDDILTKVDRASMASGLEARVPLLDDRVVEVAWHSPPALKFRHGKGKWLLREVLAQYVPRRLFERPKTGFALPLNQWLRGPLRPWADELLDPGRLRRQNLLDPEPVRQRWAAHLAGREDATQALWSVLMLQAWLELNRDVSIDG